VLTLVAQGLSNQQIAACLHISPHTAQNHLSNLYAKLRVDTRVKLARIAMDRGLVGSSRERHD
jgi:DNA-binding CsgD family transcriptional regulator